MLPLKEAPRGCTRATESAGADRLRFGEKDTRDSLLDLATKMLARVKTRCVPSPTISNPSRE
ncbi:MAG: hypothetical protein HYS77_09010 [Candidatus Rokubacteria bacterium]|nr:hypothetical protein [Candidatus Rokubacteria bacterium]